MAKELGQAELKRLARLGAAARLEQLEAERRAILRAFPGLSLAAARGGETAGAKGQAAGAAPKKKARKRRKRTAAERKAASDRMKKYWAARKQQG